MKNKSRVLASADSVWGLQMLFLWRKSALSRSFGVVPVYQSKIITEVLHDKQYCLVKPDNIAYVVFGETITHYKAYTPCNTITKIKGDA